MSKKIGYNYAILELVSLHKKLKAKSQDPAKLKSIEEGIEFLCWPYRQDMWYQGPSPLCEDNEFGILRDDDEKSRRLDIRVELSDIAYEAMEYLRGNR